MSDIWSCDPRSIEAELRLVAEKGPPVSLQREARHILSARLRQIVTHGIDMYMILSWRDRGEGEILRHIDHAVYKFAHRPFIYFPAVISRMNEQLIACRLPSCLYVLQRRRHTRFWVKGEGVAAFFLEDRPRLCRMTLVDISMGGARLKGVPRYDLDLDLTIGPATFSILGEDNQTVRQITVSRAKVVRNGMADRDTWDVGLRFELDDRERQRLVGLLTDHAGNTLFHWQRQQRLSGKTVPATV